MLFQGWDDTIIYVHTQFSPSREIALTKFQFFFKAFQHIFLPFLKKDETVIPGEWMKSNECSFELSSITTWFSQNPFLSLPLP